VCGVRISLHPSQRVIEEKPRTLHKEVYPTYLLESVCQVGAGRCWAPPAVPSGSRENETTRTEADWQIRLPQWSDVHKTYHDGGRPP